MIIRKFTAETEQEAVMQAKEEMGSNAIVLNIKTIKQRGIRKFFKKDIVSPCSSNSIFKNNSVQKHILTMYGM